MIHKKAPELIRGFFVCPEGFEPPSAEPESAILSIELWAPVPILEQI